MGSGFIIDCEDCVYSERFRIGVGMLYWPKNLVDFESQEPMLQSLISSQETVEHLRSLLQDRGGVLADDYGHRVYLCPECFKLDNCFSLTVIYDGGTYEVQYMCEDCSVKMMPTTIGYTDDRRGECLERQQALHNTQAVYTGADLSCYACPQCGKYSLRKVGCLLWD